MSQAETPDLGLVPRLATLARDRSSGVIKARQGKLLRIFCVADGDIVHAASNMVEEQLDEFLVRKKVLTPGERSVARHEAKQAGRPFADLLAEKGFLQPAALYRSQEELVRSLIGSTIDWPDGEYELSRGKPKLEGVSLVKLSLPSLLLELIRQHPQSLEDVRQRIGPPGLRLVVSEERKGVLEGVSLGAAATSLLRSCDGTLDVSELIGRINASSDEVLRSLLAFLMLGVLRVPGKEVASSRPRDRVTREEVLARLHRAEDADHYAVLGVERDASDEDIRRGYYLLARRFHPDRFRSGDLKNLLPRIENFFTGVTEAHNTLQDPDLRAQYDRDLADQEVQPKEQQDPEADKVYLARQNFARAQSLLERRSYQQAVTFLENAIELDDAQARYHFELGRVLVGNPRRREDAENALLKTIDLDPSIVDAYLQLGELYLKLDRHDEAAKMFHEVMRWEPDHVEATARLKEMGLGVGGRGGLFGG